jgi:hypothetical protein
VNGKVNHSVSQESKSNPNVCYVTTSLQDTICEYFTGCTSVPVMDTRLLPNTVPFFANHATKI